MPNDDTKRTLQDVLRRLERIERQLGLTPGIESPPTSAASPPQPTPPPLPPTSVVTPPEVREYIAATPPATPPTHPAPPPVVRPPIGPAIPLAASAPPTAPPTTPGPPPAPPIAPPIAPPTARPAALSPLASAPAARTTPPRATERSPIELLIGGKLLAWVGAAIIVLGVGFLVQLGLKSGMWERMPGGLKLSLIGAFGLALIGAGELALRTISRWASVGLFGAGLGVLYIDAYASWQWLDVFDTKFGAFVLMGFVALGGFAITLRTRFRTIGLLSLVLGYLVPPLLGSSGGHELEFLCYLTGLFGIALGLSAFLPHQFRVLRTVALVGQLTVGGVWMLAEGPRNWEMSMVFMSGWWAMLLAETVYAAMRRQSPTGNVVAMIVATAAYVTAGSLVLASTGSTSWLGAFTAAVGVLGAVAALQFGPGLDALRDRPRVAMDKLAVTLWAQFGVLIAVAIALQFDHFGTPVAWLGLSLAAFEIGRRLPSRGVDGFGFVVITLATAYAWSLRLMIMAGFAATSLDADLVVLGGALHVTRWSLIVLLGITVAVAAAFRLREATSGFWRVLPIIFTAAATAQWLAVTAYTADGLLGSWLWLAAGALMLGFHGWGRRQAFLPLAMIVFVLTAARWFLFDSLEPRVDGHWDPSAALPFLNGTMALAIAIAACGTWTMFVLRRRAAAADAVTQGSGVGWQIALIATIVALCIGGSFEADRIVERLAMHDVAWSRMHARQLAITLVWALGASALSVLALALPTAGTDGVTRAPRGIFGAACVLLGIAAAKWIVLDTSMMLIAAGSARQQVLPTVINLQAIVGVVIAAAAVLVGWTLRRGDAVTPRSGWAVLAGLAPVAAGVLILWAASFEIDRAIGRLDRAALDPWGGEQLRFLWWTMLWGLGGLAMLLIGTWRRIGTMRLGGWGIVLISGGVWLSLDTLGWRIMRGDDGSVGNVVFNLQFAVGAVLIAALAAAMWIGRRTRAAEDDARRAPMLIRVSAIAIGVLGLWLGSFEVDRFFDDPMATQAGLSVFWALYGLGLIVLGFGRRLDAARYAGLALLAITVLKVLIIDLSQVRAEWRAASLVISGLLFVITSVLYWKLSPRLLGRTEEEPIAPNR